MTEVQCSKNMSLIYTNFLRKRFDNTLGETPEISKRKIWSVYEI